MNNGAQHIIQELTPAIENKCEELKAARKERIQSRLFVILCALAVIIPTLLVFIGVSLTLLIIPVLFMCLCILILLPVLLNGQGGKSYEQA